VNVSRGLILTHLVRKKWLFSRLGEIGAEIRSQLLLWSVRKRGCKLQFLALYQETAVTEQQLPGASPLANKALGLNNTGLFLKRRNDVRVFLAADWGGAGENAALIR